MFNNSHWSVVAADMNNIFVYQLDLIEREIRTVDVLGKVLKFVEDITAISGTNEQIDLMTGRASQKQ